MNCGNCGFPLEPNNPVCPNCGTTNNIGTANNENVENVENLDDGKLTSDLTNDGFVELDDEKEEITEFMAPPELEVQNENLKTGVTDISSSNEVSTYDPEEEKKNVEEEIEQKKNEADSKVDFVIPAVKAPVETSENVQTGEIPDTVSNVETVGEKTDKDSLTGETVTVKKKFSIKLGNKSPNAVLIIVAIICIGVGVLIGKSLFSKNYCASSSNSVVNTETVKYVADGNNNVTTVGGYTLSIPEQYVYDRSSNGVFIYGENDSFRIFIRPDEGLYSELVGSKTSMRSTMIEQGVSVENVKELKSNDVKFLTFEVSYKGYNRIVGYTDASNDHVFYVEILSSDNNFNYDLLEIAGDITSNSRYEDVDSKMEKRELIDFSEISIKSAIETSSLENVEN